MLDARASAEQATLTEPAPVLYTPDVLRRGVQFAKRIRNLNLRRHCRDLAAARRVTATMPQACHDLFVTVEQRSTIFTALHPRELPAVAALLRAAAYADHFVRPPAEWRAPAVCARAQWDDLISYLFDLWPVPQAFAGAWMVPGPLLHPARDWYLHLARGGSVRGLPGMPPLRRSAAAALNAVPPHRDVLLNVRRAQLHAMQCPPALTSAVLESRMARDFSNDALWLPLIEKMIAAPEFDAAQFGIISDGLQDMVAGAEYPRARQLLRLPVTELLRYWTKHWQHLLEILRPASLDGRNADTGCVFVRRAIHRAAQERWRPVEDIPAWESRAFSCGRGPCRWTVTELLSHCELMREGRTQRHCSASYSRVCQDRKSAVFSLRCEDGLTREPVPDLTCTIEIALPSRRVIQVKSRWNRRPHPFTHAVLRQWASDRGLRLGPNDL